MTHSHEPRVLNELLDELENVRVGRSVRRKTTGALAVIALVGAAIVVSLPGQPPTGTEPAGTEIVRGTPIQPVPDAIDPEPVYAWLEIVDPDRALTHVDTTSPGSFTEIIEQDRPLRFVEFVDDAGLARALRESGSPAGVARVNGRVYLTGNVKVRPIGGGPEQPDGPPAL